MKFKIKILLFLLMLCAPLSSTAQDTAYGDPDIILEQIPIPRPRVLSLTAPTTVTATFNDYYINTTIKNYTGSVTIMVYDANTGMLLEQNVYSVKKSAKLKTNISSLPAGGTYLYQIYLDTDALQGLFTK